MIITRNEIIYCRQDAKVVHNFNFDHFFNFYNFCKLLHTYLKLMFIKEDFNIYDELNFQIKQIRIDEDIATCETKNRE